MQSVPITTIVVSSNPVHGEMYQIQQYVIKFDSDLRQVSGFFQALRFPPPIKLTATIFLLYCGSQFYWSKKSPICRKSLTNFIMHCCINFTSPWGGFELTTLVGIGPDCTVNGKSNYHEITSTTVPKLIESQRSERYQRKMKNVIILFLLTNVLGEHKPYMSGLWE